MTAVRPAAFRDADADTAFERDGFVHMPLLDADRLGHLAAVFADVAERYSGGFLATLLIPDLRHRRAVHEALAAVMDPLVSQVLHDYRPVFWGFAVKRPGAAGEVPLHQDITFLDEGGRPGITLWTPLVDVDAANGCLSLVRGSHRLNGEARGPGTPFPFPQAEADLRARHLSQISAPAGSAIAMDQRTFHCSPPNTGTGVRPAVTGILLPREAGLRYYHRTIDATGPQLEGFAVDDEFLLHHQLGSRPADLPSLGVVPESAAAWPADATAGSLS